MPDGYCRERHIHSGGYQAEPSFLLSSFMSVVTLTRASAKQSNIGLLRLTLMTYANELEDKRRKEGRSGIYEVPFKRRASCICAVVVAAVVPGTRKDGPHCGANRVVPKHDLR